VPRPKPVATLSAALSKPEPSAAVQPKPKLEPERPTPAPQPPSGSWADLPIGGDVGDDITELGDDYEDIDELLPKPAWLQIVDMIRGDAWAMFMAGAAVIAIILLLILFVLK
jgi:hypothetical protein